MRRSRPSLASSWQTTCRRCATQSRPPSLGRPLSLMTASGPTMRGRCPGASGGNGDTSRLVPCSCWRLLAFLAGSSTCSQIKSSAGGTCAAAAAAASSPVAAPPSSVAAPPQASPKNFRHQAWQGGGGQPPCQTAPLPPHDHHPSRPHSRGRRIVHSLVRPPAPPHRGHPAPPPPPHRRGARLPPTRRGHGRARWPSGRPPPLRRQAQPRCRAWQWPCWPRGSAAADVSRTGPQPLPTAPPRTAKPPFTLCVLAGYFVDFP